MKAHGHLPWMVYHGHVQMRRKLVVLGALCGHYSDVGTTKGALQGGTTALKRRQPGEKANTGEFFVENKNVGKF